MFDSEIFILSLMIIKIKIPIKEQIRDSLSKELSFIEFIEKFRFKKFVGGEKYIFINYIFQYINH